MANDVDNQFTSYGVWYSPAGAPVRVLIRLDDGSTGAREYIAGYLMFREVGEDYLPDDEVSSVSGYVIKNMSLARLEGILTILQQQIDVLKRPMVISASTDASGKVRTWLSTTRPPSKKEKAFFKE